MQSNGIVGRNYLAACADNRRFPVVTAVMFVLLLAATALGQQAGPVVVRPGAPGQPTAELSPSTRAKMLPTSAKDVEFMQGMIMHHAQAVEMVELIESRTQNKQLRLLGAKIGNSQADEMRFMQRWLEIRGLSIEHQVPSSPTGHHSHGTPTQAKPHLMPGMLTAAQMDTLRNAKGTQFDELFLQGMIQHHEGALAMVKDLFETPGAGQEAELFNFATDVDSGQRAEIKTMKTLLGEKP